MKIFKKKDILLESGIQNINKLADRYKKAKIYFHQDLDGVTTGLAMKKYLEDYGIKVVDAETIQYGPSEFAIKKPDASGEVMPVLVDFAHGKPMFVIHTDHHDTQAGAEFTKSKQFSHSRSNVKTVSEIISPSDIFTNTDIQAISTIDSADFIKYGITPQDVLNFDFKSSSTKNRFMLTFVTNKLLLTFKSKPGFLETLVLECAPSIINIYLKIRQLLEGDFDELLEDLKQNQIEYLERRKTDKDIRMEDKIIFQYGLGYIRPKGSYDRYTPFINNPDGDFLITAYPMGMVQVSCNPYDPNRSLKGINLGEVKDKVLQEFEGELKRIKVKLSSLKWISESDPGFTEESVGFTYRDLKALYGNSYRPYGDIKSDVRKVNKQPTKSSDVYSAPTEKPLPRDRQIDTPKISSNNEYEPTPYSEKDLQRIMNKHFNELDEEEKEFLDKFEISGWDVVLKNSGGHRCITNISGLNYLRRSRRPPNKEEKRPARETVRVNNVYSTDLIVENIEVDSTVSKMDKKGNKKPLSDGQYYIQDTSEIMKIENGRVVKIGKYNPFSVKEDETPYVGFVKRIAQSFKGKLVQMMQSETNVNENYFRNIIKRVLR